MVENANKLKPLLIPTHVHALILAHIRQEYPKEACGLLVGRENRVTRVLVGKNIAPDPFHNFLLDPETLLQQMEYEEHGEYLLAICHSHPHSPPVPSPTDARLVAYPNVIHVICSLTSPLRIQTRGWLLDVVEESLCQHPPPELSPVPRRRDLWARYVKTSAIEGDYILAWREGTIYRCRTVHIREVPLDFPPD